MYCGVTVFTTAFAVEKQMLFYTIALPIVDALNAFGIPTFMRYETTVSKSVAGAARPRSCCVWG